MGKACSTWRRRMHIAFSWESQTERDHYEDLDVGGRMILNWILDRLGWNGLDWTDLAQDRDK
jgi:hypothetical protein